MRPFLSCQRFLAICFAIGTVLSSLTVPPFEIRDEPAHFAKAAQVAFLAFPPVRQDGQPGAMLPADLVQLILDWWPPKPGERPAAQPIGRIWQGLTAGPPDNAGEPAFGSFELIGSYPPALYVPQAVGLRLGRLAGLPALGQFYAGRLAGAAAAIWMMLLAASLIPHAHRTLLVIAMLPSVSGQLGTYSADSQLLCIAFLSLAVALRVQAMPASRARLALPVLLPMLALAKGVYLPIAAAGLGVRAAWRPGRLAWVVGSAALGVALFAAWYSLAGGDIIPQTYIGRRSLVRMTSAVPAEQFAFMLAHPGTVAWAVIGTIVERLPAYALDGIGRYGWFGVWLPLPLYGLGVVVLAAATLETRPGAKLPTAAQRLLWAGLAFVIVVLVHLAIYLTANALGEPIVEAVQGRYLLPLLPLLAMAVRTRPHPALGRVVDAALPWGAALLMAGGILTAGTAFWRV